MGLGLRAGLGVSEYMAAVGKRWGMGDREGVSISSMNPPPQSGQ